MSAAEHYRLLLVEDSVGDQELVRLHLESDPAFPGPTFEVEARRTLAEALERLEGEPAFDVVLLDLGLPDASGSAVVERVRARTSAALIVLTGASQPGVGLACVRLGAEDFLRKADVSPGSLRRAILFSVERARQTCQGNVGSYELLERLSSGGQGEVWRARHRLLARPAAVKIVRASQLEDGPERGALIERFQREAQAIARLSAPNTVTLYDFGVSEEGDFFFVMELLRGLDFRTLVERYGPLPVERVIHLLRQVCLSLGEAHREGLVHRDVKPANLMTCCMGVQHDVVKVLDFGIVSGLGGSTEHGLGTPGYMAPEAFSVGGEADPRSDVYSLGCVLHFLLTGEQPFGDSGDQATLLERHLHEAPVPPSEINPNLPSELDPIVLRCLQKEPDLRYASVLALFEDLRACEPANAWSEARADLWWQEELPHLAEHVEASRPLTTLVRPLTRGRLKHLHGEFS